MEDAGNKEERDGGRSQKREHNEMCGAKRKRASGNKTVKR